MTVRFKKENITIIIIIIIITIIIINYQVCLMPGLVICHLTAPDMIKHIKIALIEDRVAPALGAIQIISKII